MSAPRGVEFNQNILFGVDEVFELKTGVEIEAAFAARNAPVRLAGGMAGFVLEVDGVKSDQLGPEIAFDFEFFQGVVVALEVACAEGKFGVDSVGMAQIASKDKFEFGG